MLIAQFTQAGLAITEYCNSEKEIHIESCW